MLQQVRDIPNAHRNPQQVPRYFEEALTEDVL